MSATFLLGMMLGFGAAVPIGPINLEMIRRNIASGFMAGFLIGIGACLADITYVLLLCFGILYWITNPQFLKYMGWLGAIILCWFAYKALKQAWQPAEISNSIAMPHKRTIFEGYYLTLFNPFTILFWSSVSATLSHHLAHRPGAILVASLGIIIAIFIWLIGLNFTIHHTRHLISNRITKLLNLGSGIILLGFAVYTLLA